MLLQHSITPYTAPQCAYLIRRWCGAQARHRVDFLPPTRGKRVKFHYPVGGWGERLNALPSPLAPLARSLARSYPASSPTSSRALLYFQSSRVWLKCARCASADFGDGGWFCYSLRLHGSPMMYYGYIRDPLNISAAAAQWKGPGGLCVCVPDLCVCVCVLCARVNFPTWGVLK